MLGLGFGAWRDFHQLIFNLPVGLAAAAALAVGALIAWVASKIDPKQMADGTMVFFTTAAAMLWAAGVALELNAHLSARIAETSVVVIRKEAWTGRSGATYNLWLQANAGTVPGRMRVREPLYDATRVGNHLCLVKTTGALKISWWQVAQCHQPERTSKLHAPSSRTSTTPPLRRG